MNVPSAQDYLVVAVRGWSGSRKQIRKLKKETRNYPISKMLVIDTETLTDTTQTLTFGSAQLVRIRWRRRQNGVSVYVEHHTEQEWIFHDDNLETTDPKGYAALVKYAADKGLRFVSRSDFMERVFYYHCVRHGRNLGTATAVFFNAPFDISRLAEDFGAGRGHNAGAFSFRMYPQHEGGDSRYRPRITIRHLDSKKSLISYGGTKADGQADGAGRGQFLDVRQLIWGMTNKATSLKSACEMFNLPEEYQKTQPDAHGEITPDYIDYNRQDVTATAELAVTVLREYMHHPVDLQASKVCSPASLAKAYLRKMGITPMLDRPGFPDDRTLLGHSFSTFHGGRAECHIRWTPLPIRVCDFTSMYATVNILMRLWNYITAESLTVVNATDEIRALVESATVDQLLDQTLWPSFVGLVQFIPDDDIGPVRAHYNSAVPGSYELGVNRLISGEPIWWTIPDVIASTLLTGRPPRIIRAVRVVPSITKLPGLRPVDLFGTVRVDPTKTDFFKMVVEQRRANQKNCKDHSDTCTRPGCRTAEFLKVLANSGSYGIYVEMLREDSDTKRKVTVYGAYDQSWQAITNAEETAQEFCYPIIGATITGAARLMLAILEKLVTDAGGTWLFCDTDSMAIVADKNGSLIPCIGGPLTMPDGRQAVQALTYEQVDQIRETLNRLNPYDRDKILDILKKETRTDRPECWGYGISAKRYTLFHYDENGRPIVPEKIDGKKAYSEHCLGMYLNPGDPKSKHREWIRETWQYILDKAHGLNPPDLPWFDRPALIKNAISSPHVMRSLVRFNAGKSYADKVKPFNFILSTTWRDNPLDGANEISTRRYIAPYTNDPSEWESPDCLWYDLSDPNADPIPGDRFQFKRMRVVVKEYMRHAECKSLGPDGLPCTADTVGLLQRRTVRLQRLTHIGKETNKLEDVERQLYVDASKVVTEYPRPDRSDVINILNQYGSLRGFAAWVSGEKERNQQRIRTDLMSRRQRELRDGLFNWHAIRTYGKPVHIDYRVIGRFVTGAPISEQHRQAIIRCAAELVAPTIGIAPETIKRVRGVDPETVIAMWRDAGEPSIGTPESCRCGCGHDAAPRSGYASNACRVRYNRWRRNQDAAGTI
jgi:hypothetical protein